METRERNKREVFQDSNSPSFALNLKQSCSVGAMDDNVKENIQIVDDQLKKHCKEPIESRKVLSSLAISESTVVSSMAISSGSGSSKQAREISSPMDTDVCFQSTGHAVLNKDQRESSSVEGHSRIQLSVDYVSDFLAYMRAKEFSFLPRAEYMKRQVQLNVDMRTILVDWLVDVSGELCFEFSRTMHLCVNYVDRFLSRMSVNRNKLQLVGTGALFVATKYQEIYPPEVLKLSDFTADTYTSAQILAIEQLLLDTLQYNLEVPTAYDFAEIFLFVSGADQVIRLAVDYIVDMSLLDYQLVGVQPSLVAAAAIWLAYFYDLQPLSDARLQQICGCCVEQLAFCIGRLYWLLSNARNFGEAAIYNKFNESERGEISGKLQVAVEQQALPAEVLVGDSSRQRARTAESAATTRSATAVGAGALSRPVGAEAALPRAPLSALSLSTYANATAVLDPSLSLTMPTQAHFKGLC